jgi:hypothetical protein
MQLRTTAPKCLGVLLRGNQLRMQLRTTAPKCLGALSRGTHFRARVGQLLVMKSHAVRFAPARALEVLCERLGLELQLANLSILSFDQLKKGEVGRCLLSRCPLSRCPLSRYPLSRCLLSHCLLSRCPLDLRFRRRCRRRRFRRRFRRRCILGLRLCRRRLCRRFLRRCGEKGIGGFFLERTELRDRLDF